MDASFRNSEVPFLGSNKAFLLVHKPEPAPKPRLHALYADPVMLQEEDPVKTPAGFQAEGLVSINITSC